MHTHDSILETAANFADRKFNTLKSCSLIIANPAWIQATNSITITMSVHVHNIHKLDCSYSQYLFLTCSQTVYEAGVILEYMLS